MACDGSNLQSRQIVNENQVICVESLKVKNMLRNRSLAKSISDAGWGEFVRQLAYKADWAGGQLSAIIPGSGLLGSWSQLTVILLNMPEMYRLQRIFSGFFAWPATVYRRASENHLPPSPTCKAEV